VTFPRRSVVLLTLLIATLAPTQAATAHARVAMGAYIEGADRNPNRVDRYTRLVGRRPVIVNIYKDWGASAFEHRQLQGLWRRGAVPMITWEPWGHPLRAIANGRYDRYVRASARSVAHWGKPVMVRFAHEMNGNWYPWGNGASARAYKQAWRHVVSIFRREGANNAQWVWSPYASAQYSFVGRFPGKHWVDWLGLDGFNWGGSRPWESFRRVFGGSYRAVQRLSPAPIVIAETGSGEAGGSKARWLAEALNRTLPHMHRVRALVWYSALLNSLGDYRVNSSGSALRALRRALREPRYQLSRGALVGASHRNFATSAARRSPFASGGWCKMLGRLVGGWASHL